MSPKFDKVNFVIDNVRSGNFYSHDIGQRNGALGHFPNEFIATVKKSKDTETIELFRVLPNKNKDSIQRGCVRVCYYTVPQGKKTSDVKIAMRYGTDESTTKEIELNKVYRVNEAESGIEEVKTGEIKVVNQTNFSQLKLMIKDANGLEIVKDSAFSSVAVGGNLAYNRCLFGYKDEKAQHPTLYIVYICKIEKIINGKSEIFYGDLFKEVGEIATDSIDICLMNGGKVVAKDRVNAFKRIDREYGKPKIYRSVTEFNVCYTTNGLKFFKHVFGKVVNEKNYKFRNGPYVHYLNDFIVPVVKY